ncbi:1057_t:CDS:2, partial [Diversispora eburnea]
PCVPLLGNSNPKLKDVENCLTSFPYNKTRAKSTIETLKSLTNDFYVFNNQAKEQPHPGFTFDPIDLEKELDKILATNYKTDYNFLTDIRKLYIKLHDGHTQFYASFFHDFLDSTNIDCEVTLINSKPAIEEITNFAKNNSFISRDLGVRFNNALTSLSLVNGVLDISGLGSEFVLREDIPESDGIEYTLNCPNNKQPKNFKREWLIGSTYTTGFKDSKSFFENNCLWTINDATSKKVIDPQKTIPYSHHYVKTLTETESDTPNTSKPKYSLSQATLVFATYRKAIQFYQSGDIGIVVVSTVPLGADLVKGFKLLAEKGVKKLVLDLSNNRGGSVVFAEYFNSFFVPSKRAIFPDDISVESPLVRKAINASVGTNGVFDPTSFIDFRTGKYFKNAADFIGSNKYKRGGTLSSYSNKHNFEPNSEKKLKLPWNNTNTIIITNGVCGSACSLITEFLSEAGKIRTIAVGGLYEEKLSYSSFTGGNNLDSDDIFRFLIDLKIKYVPDFEYLGTSLGFNFREAYSLKDPNVVLDFDFRPADFRLYYNEKNARDPSLLWEDATRRKMVDLDNIPQELREQIYIIQQWMRDLRLDGDLEISRNGIKYNGQPIDISTVTIGELKRISRRRRKREL